MADLPTNGPTGDPTNSTTASAPNSATKALHSPDVTAALKTSMWRCGSIGEGYATARQWSACEDRWRANVGHPAPRARPRAHHDGRAATGDGRRVQRVV